MVLLGIGGIYEEMVLLQTMQPMVVFKYNNS